MFSRTPSLPFLAIAFAIGCSSGDRDASDTSGARRSSGSVDLTGAGATFPYPIYSKWFSDYAQSTGVRINYQSIGSGGGIRQLSEGTVDFGATDSPMSDEEIARARGGNVVHIPTVIGAVAVIYNAPGLRQPLRLDGATLADIFLGRIRKWNDQRIARLNPGVSLPTEDILVVHRSDGSGTTFVFTDYLSAVSQSWAAGPGKGKDVRWPLGLGGKGNEGVAGQVKQTPGAIGYAELAYAKQNNLSVAAVQNRAGEFVVPTIEAVTAAAESMPIDATSDYRVSIVNAPRGYPISSFTWIILYQNQPDGTKGKKITDFLHWALRDGQRSAPSLDYAPLPAPMLERLHQRIDSIRVGGGQG